MKNMKNILRERNSVWTLVVGSNLWQNYRAVKDLCLSEYDKNLIKSFHYYHLFLLTYRLASWIAGGKYAGVVHYLDNVALTDDFDSPSVVVADKFESRLRYHQVENAR